MYRIVQETNSAYEITYSRCYAEVCVVDDTDGDTDTLGQK